MNKIFDWKHRHYGEHVFIVLILLSGWMDFLPLPKTLTQVLSITATIVMLLALVLLLFHEQGPLCETCISSMPLNVDEVVERRKRHLRFRHLFIDDPTAVWKLIGGWVVYLVLLWLLGGESFAGMLLGALFNTAVAYLLFSGAVHRRLMPWCPWCRRRGPGEDEDIEAPDPVQPERV